MDSPKCIFQYSSHIAPFGQSENLRFYHFLKSFGWIANELASFGEACFVFKP